MASRKLFTIDGNSYDVIVPEDGIRQEDTVVDGENAGRTEDGGMVRDLIGTYPKYEIDVLPNPKKREDYDALYAMFVQPKEYHMIEVPYGQTYITYKGYGTSANRTLKRITSDGVMIWHGMTLIFTANDPYLRP